LVFYIDEGKRKEKKRDGASRLQAPITYDPENRDIVKNSGKELTKYSKYAIII